MASDLQHVIDSDECITCPFCLHERHDDLEDFDDRDDREIECGECERSFTVRTQTTRNFTSLVSAAETEGANSAPSADDFVRWRNLPVPRPDFYAWSATHGEAHCGKPAASFIPRLGQSFACVLTAGHNGECAPGGTCFEHGPYIGKPGTTPRCPKCPAPNPLLQEPSRAE